MTNSTALLARVQACLPAMRQRAQALDAAASFPTEDIADLRAAGVLRAPLPQTLGGLGIGTDPGQATGTLSLLTVLGRGNLSVGRVLEAHINALRLVVRAADAATLADVAADVAAGHLFALWVTDPPAGGLSLQDRRVTGRKQFCSAAGHATRAVVTAAEGSAADAGPGNTVRLCVVALDRGIAVTPLDGGLQGMRAAMTGQVAFDGVPAVPFGAPGDYLREPDFSCGAWRTSAVTLGGLEALVEHAVRQITSRGRAGDPHQQARMGQAMMARETARLWMREAAGRAEGADRPDADPPGAVAYVNFARLAVERACLEAMALVQRSLGAPAFVRPNPVELLCRDLGTYLRQPAVDAVLTEAAAHGMGLQ